MSTASTLAHDQINTNCILDALPVEEYEQLLPHLEHVKLRLGEVLAQPEEIIRYVYFPHRATISLVVIMKDGSEAEAGVVGNEGMSGIPIILGTDSTPLQMVVQVADSAMRIRADVFREKLTSCPQLNKLALRFALSFLVQTAQTAACNRLHRLDSRLARWLLMCQDRKKSDTLELTHEFIAIMLGVRRSGVSVAASTLQSTGLIRYNRGRIQVLDRQGMEKMACECYYTIKREFDRLLCA